MWATTPTYAVIIAFLSWMVLCWVRIWPLPSGVSRSGPVRAALFPTVRRVFLLLYAFLGIHLLDIVARICFLDLIGYGRFSCVAAPVLLCAALGVLYIIGGAFVSPTWSTLAAFAGMAGTYLYMSALAPLPQLDVSLWVGAGLTVALSLLEALRSRGGQRRKDGGAARPNRLLSPPIWDFSREFGRMTGAGPHAVVLVLLSVELVLQFEGLSLLCLR